MCANTQKCYKTPFKKPTNKTKTKIKQTKPKIKQPKNPHKTKKFTWFVLDGFLKEAQKSINTYCLNENELFQNPKTNNTINIIFNKKNLLHKRL